MVAASTIVSAIYNFDEKTRSVLKSLVEALPESIDDDDEAKNDLWAAFRSTCTRFGQFRIQYLDKAKLTEDARKLALKLVSQFRYEVKKGVKPKIIHQIPQYDSPKDMSAFKKVLASSPKKVSSTVGLFYVNACFYMFAGFDCVFFIMLYGNDWVCP